MFAQENNRNLTPVSRFTLIELLIVLATVAVVLTVSLPVFSNYSIRAKLTDSLREADAAKSTIVSACGENVENSQVGTLPGVRQFVVGVDHPNITRIRANGACSAPVITITTRSTGRIPDPILSLVGTKVGKPGQITWQCSSSNTPSWLLPYDCRG